jgi:hypothetical protein
MSEVQPVEAHELRVAADVGEKEERLLGHVQRESTRKSG